MKQHKMMSNTPMLIRRIAIQRQLVVGVMRKSLQSKEKTMMMMMMMTKMICVTKTNISCCECDMGGCGGGGCGGGCGGGGAAAGGIVTDAKSIGL